ncbi:MAG: hypothetical protein KBC48_01955 [Candidatus Pacebacteria bacterium]|nr:hypothetical protein [Candidatus Paceibacterota bacterium]
MNMVLVILMMSGFAMVFIGLLGLLVVNVFKKVITIVHRRTRDKAVPILATLAWHEVISFLEEVGLVIIPKEGTLGWILCEKPLTLFSSLPLASLSGSLLHNSTIEYQEIIEKVLTKLNVKQREAFINQAGTRHKEVTEQLFAHWEKYEEKSRKVDKEVYNDWMIRKALRTVGK